MMMLQLHVLDFANTILYRDYAHPYCMLQNSYRWNFENSSFASKLSPLRC